jgi:peptide/nickel transport system permease protein
MSAPTVAFDPLEPPEPDVLAPRRRLRRRQRNTPLVAGLTLFGLIVLVALCAPLLTSHDPIQQSLNDAFLAPGSAGHPLGTDALGRDVWARLLYGARVDLRVAVLAVVSPFIIGSLTGLVAGWFGGWIDTIIGRVIDVVIAFPFLVLIIALVFTMGPGTTSIYVAITLVGWVAYARIVRAQVLVAKEQEYAMAARVSGLPTWRILLRHLLPNVVLQAIVFSMSDIVLTLLAIVTLGFLGLGVPPPTPDWGTMIQEGQQFILSKWYMSTIPGLAVVLTGLSLALIADGIVEKANRR